MLEFSVDGAIRAPYAMVPTLLFGLCIKSAAPLDGIALHVQIRLEPGRRNYADPERERLFELFGPPDEWGRTVHNLLWTHVDLMVPGFQGQASAELAVPCSFDFNLAVTKYFAALEGGEIPLMFLFSGTVFGRDEAGRMRVSRISWEAEAAFRLPAALWREMMERYYPEGTWLSVRRDWMQRLMEFKREHSLASLEQALEMLLPGSEPAAQMQEATR